MRMDERKYRILQAIIDDYILTGMPVGSRTISRKYDIGGLSSATIRNEMSDLEEMGFLDQPHTSAGRIPSARAYRLYVENLLREAHTLSEEEEEHLKAHFNRRAKQMEEVILSAAQAISEVTNYTAVITTPRLRNASIRRVQLVPVSDNMALMVIVTDTGIVRDTMIRIDGSMTADDLHKISNLLTDQLRGLNSQEIHERLSEIKNHLGKEVSIPGEIFSELDREDAAQQETVLVGGRSNILSYPEYFDAEKARAVLGVLEKRDKLLQLMSGAPQMAFTIRIGDETGMPETSDCSVVSMTYRIGDETAGTIGVIGPTRMRYARVIPVLDFMGKALAELLKE